MNENNQENNIPLFVLDQHHRAYNYIQKNVQKGILPKTGNTIIHLDAHIDDIVPKDVQILAQLDSKITSNRLFSDIGYENWLKTAVNDKCIEHIIWVKPPWAIQVEDGNINLESASIDIKTLGKSVFENVMEDYDGFKSIFYKYLTPGEPYILDIEYNFLSSDSPFTSEYSEANDYFKMLKDIFALNIPDNKIKETLEKAADERNEKLNQLRKLFGYLEEHRKLPVQEKENYPKDLYEKVSALYEYLLQYYSDENINWQSIYNAGSVSNDYQLPVHHTSKENITKMLECVKTMLKLLPSPPSLITIAIMYEYDRFTPNETREFIGEELMALLLELYENIDVEYEDY